MMFNPPLTGKILRRYDRRCVVGSPAARY